MGPGLVILWHCFWLSPNPFILVVWLISALELSPRSLGNSLTTALKVMMISIPFLLFTRILKNGWTWFYVMTVIIFLISSILEKFFTEVRYHPFLENFPEYTSLRREPVSSDPTEKFSFGRTMTSGTRYSGYYSLYLYLLQLMTPVLSPALRWLTVSRRMPSQPWPATRPDMSHSVTGRTDPVSSFLCSAAGSFSNMWVGS